MNKAVERAQGQPESLSRRSIPSKRISTRNVPFSERRITTPEQDRQANHEERMRAEIRGDGEVAVERGRAQLLLHPGEVRRLPSDQRQGLLAQVIPPLGQRPLVYARLGLATVQPSCAPEVSGRESNTVVMTPEPCVGDLSVFGSCVLRRGSGSHGGGLEYVGRARVKDGAQEA